ncbi:MAG TPA: hypothetical protein VI112_06360, partial [Bacteroidia bacterium]
QQIKALARQWKLVHPRYRFRYTGKWPALAGSFFFCLLVALVKPLADVLVFIIGLFMGEERVLKSATA